MAQPRAPAIHHRRRRHCRADGSAGLRAARLCGAALRARRDSLDQTGAGLQLSPNAVRLLEELGVTDALAGRRRAPRPCDAARCARAWPCSRACGSAISPQQRWGAPYLVAHRADLHSALIARAAARAGHQHHHRCGGPRFRRCTATASPSRSIATARSSRRRAGLLVGADGVWSSLRGLAGDDGQSRFSGRIAWRATVRADGAAGKIFAGIGRAATASPPSCIRTAT